MEVIRGTEKNFDVDTICLAVGLSPMLQLAKMAGCEMEENPKNGGYVSVCDQYGETSIKRIFAAWDVSGIEEASSAMIEGRIAGALICLYIWINLSSIAKMVGFTWMTLGIIYLTIRTIV